MQMSEEETALTVKVQGSKRLVYKTIDRMKENFQVAYVSSIMPNLRDEGVHAFLTILEES